MDVHFINRSNIYIPVKNSNTQVRTHKDLHEVSHALLPHCFLIKAPLFQLPPLLRVTSSRLGRTQRFATGGLEG